MIGKKDNIHVNNTLADLITNEEANKPAQLTVVGAGPGDVELITLKAIKALQACRCGIVRCPCGCRLIGICTKCRTYICWQKERLLRLSTGADK